MTERDPLDGVIVSHNPCLSGGALEIFLDPQPVAPRMVIVGETPIARALAAIAGAAGYEVGDASQAGDAALVVASHGEGEEAALAAALDAGVDYIALVASPKRGAAVLNALDEALRSRVHTPAGLDIGARTPADIAISILAQLIASRTRPRARGRDRRRSGVRDAGARERADRASGRRRRARLLLLRGLQGDLRRRSHVALVP